LAGQTEIIALSELYDVNCIVWEVKDGYAEQIFRHMAVSSDAITVHLHMAGRKHYEFTDIPTVKILIN
jgi:hypothetical protein